MPAVPLTSSNPGNYPALPPWGTPLSPLGSSAIAIWSSQYNGGSVQPTLGKVQTTTTLNGAGATRIFGAYGRCIALDGSTGFISASLPTITIPTEGSFGAGIGTAITWFRTSGTPGANYYWIVGNTTSLNSAVGWYLVLSPTGAPTVNVEDATPTTVAQLVAGTGYNDGNWHMAAFVWRQGTGAVQKLYLDGGDVITATTSGTWTMPGSSPIIRWGISQDTFWGKFVGAIDPGAWFPYELSATTIRQLVRFGPGEFYRRSNNFPVIYAAATPATTATSGAPLIACYG